MHTILFVDDEPHIIDGLKRTLRSMRQEWQMCFAGSGVEALQLMEQQPFDVIVTDMRMPGMTGAQLLAEVLKLYPQMVRVMLSGHSDLQAIMQSVGPTHQYLSKPCDVSLLKKTVTDVCALRDILGSPTLRQMVAEMKCLPSLPPLYSAMMAAAQMPGAPVEAISDVISQDVAMTAKILQIVNSAYFGLPRRVSNVLEAISLLGLDTVRALMLSLQVFAPFDAAVLPDFSADAFWRHSLLVAKLAKEIALAEGGDQRECEDAYTAGLLHDVGKLALAIHTPKEYAKALAYSRQNAVPMHNAEMEIFGASHAEVGAYLMGLWGLPTSIVEALAFHHAPDRCNTTHFCPLTAVHAADCMMYAMEGGSGLEHVAFPVNGVYIKQLQLTDHVKTWQTLCCNVLDSAEI